VRYTGAAAMTIKAVFEKTLVRAGEVRSFQVLIGRNGWEVSERDDQKVARHYHADWHHVERTLMRFSHEIAALRNQGWRES
jgi:hypothetical protein